MAASHRRLHGEEMRFKKTIGAILATLTVAGACALELEQRDDFQSGTLQSWEGGASPVLIGTGGPAGDGDAFLQITSAPGGGLGGKLATYNVDQWTGNYQAVGIRSIDVHMRNQSDIPVDMRVVIFGPVGSRFTSVNAIRLQPGTGWVRCSFPIGRNDLVRVLGGESYDEVIVGVSRLMFRHDSDPASFGGDDIAAQLGIDNVTGNPWPSAIASNFTVRRGIQTGGNLSSLWFSDNGKLVVQQRPPFLVSDPSAQVQVTATSPLATPSAVNFRAEVASNFLPASNAIQRLEMFNYSTGRWDVVDERAPTLTDSVISVRVGSGYVESGTRKMEARIGVFDRGSAFPNWNLSVDAVTWFLEP